MQLHECAQFVVQPALLPKNGKHFRVVGILKGWSGVEHSLECFLTILHGWGFRARCW